MSGYDAMPHEDWPEIAAALALPWPEKAARHDLRVYAADAGLHGSILPTVRELALRWGWKRTRVWKLVADQAAWTDASRPWGWQSGSAQRPESEKKRTRCGQAADNERTSCGHGKPTNADNPANSGQAADNERTSGGQDADSRACLGCSPDHPSPDHPPLRSGTAGAAPAASGEGPGVGMDPTPNPATTPGRRAPAPPGYTEAIAAFAEEHLAVRKGAYPWVWGGRDGDGPRVKVWLRAAEVAEDDVAGGVERIRGAARAYFRAVDAGMAWPEGEPASTRHFTREIARWLQTDPHAEPTGPPARASPPQWKSIDQLLAEESLGPSRPSVDATFIEVPP